MTTPKPHVFKMKTHKSTNIAASSYHPESKTLRVQFHSGSTYDYHDVSADIATAFETSKSIGSFVAMNIRGKYKTTLVSGGKVAA